MGDQGGDGGAAPAAAPPTTLPRSREAPLPSPRVPPPENRKPVVVMSETAAAAPRRSARPARLRARLVCGSVSSAVAVTVSAHLAKAATLATRLCRSFRSPAGHCRRSSGWPVPAPSSEPKRAARPAKRVSNVPSVATSPVVVRLPPPRLVSALAPSARRALISVALVKISRSPSLLWCDDGAIPASHRRCTSPRGRLPLRFARSPLRSRGSRSRRALRSRCASKATTPSAMQSSLISPAEAI